MRPREEKQFNCIKAAFLDDRAHFHVGINEAEKTKLKEIINNAKPNPNEYDYPDYLTDIATIELFEITSSKVKRKGGSTQTREKKKYDKEVLAEQQEILRTHAKNKDDYYKQYGWRFSRPEHSHEFLKSSFENNFNNHLESLKKYEGNQSIAIFAVSYTDMALSGTDGNAGVEIIYQLSLDKDLLDFINGNSEYVDYVIFESPFCVEVIKTIVPSDLYKKDLVFKENNIGIATVMHRVKLLDQKKNEQD